MKFLKYIHPIAIIAAALTCFMLFSAFSTVLELSFKVDERNNIIFTIPSTPWPFDGGSNLVRGFYVYKKINENFDYRNPVWGVQMPFGRVKYIKAIKYGELPGEMILRTPPEKLVTGITYHAMAEGSGWNAGIDFTVQKNAP